MEVIILGLYGPMGAGKSSVASGILADHKDSAKQIRFADPLYRFAKLSANWRFKDSDSAAFELFDLTADLLGGKGAASFMDVSQAVLSPVAVPMLLGGAASLDSPAGRRLTFADREVASRVNGTWDVASVALACPLREVETLKALRKLVRLGLVDLQDRR